MVPMTTMVLDASGIVWRSKKYSGIHWFQVSGKKLKG
jgi:hypothetical protein